MKTTSKTKTSDPVIEKRVTIPPITQRGRKLATSGVAATIRAMIKGDSVLVPSHKRFSWQSVARMCGVTVSVRKMSDTEHRLWRTN